MAGDPAKPTVSGEFSLVGPKCANPEVARRRCLLDAGNKLARLSLKGRMASAGGNVQVTDAAFELDDVKGTGGVVVTFSVPLSVVTHLEFDTLDLDPFFARPAGGPKQASSTPTAAPANQAPPAGPSFGLKTKVAKLIYNKETIGGVEVDVALHGSTLTLNDIKVSNLGGARLAVRGSVANLSSALPRPDIAFNFEAPDMSSVLKIVGGRRPGSRHGEGQRRRRGTVEAITFKQLNVSAQGNRGLTAP